MWWIIYYIFIWLRSYSDCTTMSTVILALQGHLPTAARIEFIVIAVRVWLNTILSVGIHYQSSVSVIIIASNIWEEYIMYITFKDGFVSGALLFWSSWWLTSEGKAQSERFAIPVMQSDFNTETANVLTHRLFFLIYCDHLICCHLDSV